jgi:hypothetical protein
MGALDDTREWLSSVASEGLGRLELLRYIDRSRVREWRWPGAAAANDSINLDERAKEMVRTAERDGLSRYQREVSYLLIAYRPEDQGGGDFAEHTFRVPGGSSKGGAHGDDEQPATRDGLLQQLMKHNADMHRLLLASHEGRTASLERQLVYLTDRVEAADKRHMHVITLAEELASQKMEQELQRKQFELEERRQKYVSEKLDTFAPVALNRLLGGGPGSGKLPMGDELIKQLFGKMSAERVEALLTGQPITLSADEAMLVAEIYATFGSKDAAREAARNGRPLNGHDANGVSGDASASTEGKGKPS